MKFKIKENSPEPQEIAVELSLCTSYNGNVMLKANGRVILWVRQDGIIMRNTMKNSSLKDMGFKVNASGVHIAGIDED